MITATTAPPSHHLPAQAPAQVPAHHAWRQRLAGWLLLLAALVLYGLTLDNGLQPEELVGGDLITHQYAQVQARPSNAPGYPLYTMGGWLWFHGGRLLLQTVGVALPNPLFLLSSYSTVWAILALWLLYQLLCRLTRSARTPAGNWLLAGLLSLFYATTYFFWYYATTTEQYSSAIAQTLAIVYGYLGWREQAKQGVTTANRRLLWLAFLCGLSLAHMLTVAFIVPGVVVVILWAAPYLLRQWRVVVGALIAAFLPLGAYLYVYWRGITHPEWWGAGEWANGQAWFWAFVSTAQGREELGWGFAAGCPFFANGFPLLMGRELSWLIVGLGVVGIARLDRRLATLFYSTLLIYLGFSWAYRCGNWFQVILPAYALLMLGVAAGLHELWQWLTSRAGQAGRAAIVTWLSLVLLSALVGWNLARNWTAADSRNRPSDSALDRAAVLLAQPLPPNAALFAAVEEALAIQYLTQIWGVRPDLQMVSSQAAALLLAQGTAVYSSWQATPTLRAELPTTIAATTAVIDPHWVRFGQPGESQPMVPHTQVDQPATAAITLTGYTFSAAPPSPLAKYRPPITAASTGVALTLFWQVDLAGWPPDVAISVRPTRVGAMIKGSNGHDLQQDRAQPATGLATAGTTQLVDPYQFVTSTETAAPIDGAQVILYRQTATGFENLAVLMLVRQ